MTRIPTPFGLALVACLLAGCSSEQSISDSSETTTAADQPTTSAYEAMLFEVFGEPDSRKVELGVNTCNKNPQAEVVATEAEVRIAIVFETREGDTGSGDCADSVKIVLDEPLGSRTVIDDATGEEVKILEPGST